MSVLPTGSARCPQQHVSTADSRSRGTSGHSGSTSNPSGARRCSRRHREPPTHLKAIPLPNGCLRILLSQWRHPRSSEYGRCNSLITQAMRTGIGRITHFRDPVRSTGQQTYRSRHHCGACSPQTALGGRTRRAERSSSALGKGNNHGSTAVCTDRNKNLKTTERIDKGTKIGCKLRKQQQNRTMTYHIVCQHEHGGYRCETQQPDLASAISLTLAKARESRRRHYIVDDSGKLIDTVQPA